MSEKFQCVFPADTVIGIIHGSLGTDEDIAYSDFDALVIIRQIAFRDPRLLADICQKLTDLQRIMFLQDPLQHHGCADSCKSLHGV